MLLLAVTYYSGIDDGVISKLLPKSLTYFAHPVQWYLGHMIVRMVLTEVTLFESALTHKVCKTIDEFIEEN